MSKFDEFISWESTSRDTIDFKKTYVDMAGDVLAGLVLSEIIFWYLPNKQGQSKLRIKKEKMYWIACPRHEWWNRCRLSPRQIDRCFSILVEKGLIEKKRFRFNNAPTIHIRILEDAFMEQFNALIANPPVNPFLPNGEIGINENVKSDFNESGNSLTETIAETTKEKESASPIGNAAGNASEPMTYQDIVDSIEVLQLVLDTMVTWPNAPFQDKQKALDYLIGLYKAGKFNAEDKTAQDVLAVVKQALITPPDAAAQHAPAKPSELTPMYAMHAKPGNISQKQWDANRPAYLLGIAMDILVTDGDLPNFKRVAKVLMESGLAPAQFKHYVTVIQKLAVKENGWNVTVNSLITNGRIGSYFSGKYNYLDVRKKAQPTATTGTVFDLMGD